MSSTILPNSICLLNMSDDELREELLRDVYNNANLREMIRRLAKLAMDYAKSAEYEREKNVKYKNAIEYIKSEFPNEV